MSVVLLTVTLTITNGQPTDYALQRYSRDSTGFIPPFGDSTCTYRFPSQNDDNRIGIMYWRIPPVLLPGMRCKVEVKWLVRTNHVPVTYVNYFGSWQPYVELARSNNMYGGIPSSGAVYKDTFSFIVPDPGPSGGWYTIRFMWILAYNPVRNYFAGPNPGEWPHAFSEITFHVGYLD